jgi:tetratricopeptide (TPR) repeat protein
MQICGGDNLANLNDDRQLHLLLDEASDYFEAEKYEFAITLLLSNVKRYPQQFLLHDLLARAYLFNDQPHEAISEAFLALSLSPLKASSYELLAMIHIINRQPMQGLKHYILAVKHSPTDVSLYLYTIKTMFFETLWFVSKLFRLA